MHGFSNDFNLYSLDDPEHSREIGGFFDEFLPEPFLLSSFDSIEISPQIDYSLPGSFFSNSEPHFPPEAFFKPNTSNDSKPRDNLLNTNQKLNGKTKNTLELTPTTTESLIADKNEEDKVNTLSSVRKRPGPFIIERVTNNKDTTNPELERTKNSILTELRTWTADTRNHKHIIDLLEKYKKLVLKYTEEYFNKINELSEFKDSLINSLNNKNAMKKEEFTKYKKQKRAKGKKIWDQVDFYLEDISPTVKKSFEKLLMSTYKNTISNGFLNIGAINQIAAIAKMLQYCNENGITINEFIEDRIYSKIKAKCIVNKLVYAPNLDEIGYLMSLDTHCLNEIINSLKDRIQYKPSLIPTHSLEEQLNQLSLNNKRIIQQILKRINNPKKVDVENDKESKKIQEANNDEKKGDMDLVKKGMNNVMTASRFQVLKNLTPFPSVQHKNTIKLKK